MMDPFHEGEIDTGDIAQDFDDDFDFDDNLLWVKHRAYTDDRDGHRDDRRPARRKPQRSAAEVYRELTDIDDATETGIEISYKAARHEQGWIIEALRPFFYQGLITDVLRLAKGGKEANVYVCAADPALGAPYLAAKVYRPRRFRNLRNDALYRAGRRPLDIDGHLIKDSRAVHAMQKGTGFGKELAHTSWLAHEHDALSRLHAAGADVPETFGMADNAILMTYIGDATLPAPTLNHVALAPGEAAGLFERVLHNVDLMLAARAVHGDLSAYNILYWQGAITLIDFPQVVDPFENPAGRAIFERDLARVCDYFAGYGVGADAGALAEALWDKHVPAELWAQVPLVDEEIEALAGAERRGRW